MTGDFTVRRMATGEVGLIRRWADGEGWNPGTHDGPAFFAADPEGFFVGELAGEPVACVSCVRHGDAFGFLGQSIVRPDCRGRRFGLAVWAAGMAHLVGRNVGLEGVLAQVPNYERSGFRFAHPTVRFAGTGGGTSPDGLVPLGGLSFAELADYDAAGFPARREAFLRAWAELPGAVALADVRGGRVAGYGVLRGSSDGYKVGPPFACSPGSRRRSRAGRSASMSPTTLFNPAARSW